MPFEVFLGTRKPAFIFEIPKAVVTAHAQQLPDTVYRMVVCAKATIILGLLPAKRAAPALLLQHPIIVFWCNAVPKSI